MKEVTQVLDTAKKVVSGPRRKAYGDAEESFTRIAALWNSYLDLELTAHDVSMMMILLKVSREKANHGEDNLVDIAGYAALANILV